MNHTVSGKIMEDLIQAEKQLSQDQINGLLSKVQSHNRVFVYGAGRTGLILKTFAMRLMQMRRTSFVVGETITPAIQSDDLLMVASSSGSTKSVCDYVKSAVEQGIDVAAIVGCTNSSLEAYIVPDLIVQTGNKYDDSGLQPMGSLFEQLLLIVLDAIVLEMSGTVEDRHAMQKRHANME